MSLNKMNDIEAVADAAYKRAMKSVAAPKTSKPSRVALERVVRELREQLEGAERILACYSSPFPDAIERYNRSVQLRYVKKLERAVNRAEKKLPNDGRSATGSATRNS